MDNAGVTTDPGTPELAPAAFVPGAVVAGRYRLESRLGAGGGGTVWRCTDQKLDAIVALKIVSSDGDMERWRREVAMARRIAHHNVCRVHDLGEAEDTRFVTMELVEGTSLRSKIRPDLSADEAHALWRQIVSGVAAIHAAGVVHRDLKPENIVVANDGRAVIVDFGLAREPRGLGDQVRTAVARGPSGAGSSQQTVTNDGTIVGTPRYMAPEQAAAETVDARADVWALGLIGHELLTGVMPDTVSTGRKLSPIVDSKSPDIAHVLQRCLALRPEDRFADARALLAALTVSPRRWPRRAMIVIAGLAAAFGGVLVVRSLRSTSATPPVGPYRMQQITTTEKEWPGGSPLSIALSPDAQRFAYTTGDGKLFVRDLAGGTATQIPLPRVEKRDLFVTSFAAGWYSDGSIAALGSTRTGEWQLVRIYADGRNQLVYKHAQRFTAAVSVDDRVAIGIPDYAIFVIRPGDQPTPDRISTIGRGETLMGLAWSPDGSRIACSRLPAAGEEAVVQVMSASGAEIREVWRGHTIMFADTLLVWLDDDRLAHSYQEPGTRKTVLTTIRIATGETTVHETFDGTYVGIGSGARGIVILLRGMARREVQIGDKTGDKLAPLHDRALSAGFLAGWTTDGHVVFAAGATADKLQIVRAIPGTAPEPWPNTRAGLEVPDTIVGDDVIAHRVDGARTVIERIDPAGKHTQLAELATTAAVTPVRCAGDRGPPCVIEETDGNTVRWTEIDPATGSRGAMIHQRQTREQLMRAAALSPDGAVLAIVDGGHDVTVIDRATGTAERPRETDDGAALQSLGFGPSNELWATSIGSHGRLFGLMSFTRYPDHFGPPHDRGPWRDSMRFYWGPTPSPDGSRVAVAVREFHIDVWRADGL